MRSYLYGMWIYRLLHLGPGMLHSSVWTAFQAQSREGLAIFGLPRKEILCFSLPYRPCPNRMKPAMKIMFFLCLFAGTWIAEAGKGQREAKGQGRRYDGRSHKDSHRSSYEYDYYDHVHDRRGSSHSRRRRRRRSSDSRTPDCHRRRSAEKPPKNSPGYEEYKRQKQEAAAWQERHLQAQALALCLEERERQKISAQQQPAPVVSPPAPAAAPEIQPAQSSGLEIPPLPQQECKTQVQPKGKGKPQPAQSDKIPVAYLKLLEAELGHIVNFGNKPLTVGAVESQLQAVKPAGKRLDVFWPDMARRHHPHESLQRLRWQQHCWKSFSSETSLSVWDVGYLGFGVAILFMSGNRFLFSYSPLLDSEFRTISGVVHHSHLTQWCSMVLGIFVRYPNPCPWSHGGFCRCMQEVFEVAYSGTNVSGRYFSANDGWDGFLDL